MSVESVEIGEFDISPRIFRARHPSSQKKMHVILMASVNLFLARYLLEMRGLNSGR